MNFWWKMYSITARHDRIGILVVALEGIVGMDTDLIQIVFPEGIRGDVLLQVEVNIDGLFGITAVEPEDEVIGSEVEISLVSKGAADPVTFILQRLKIVRIAGFDQASRLQRIDRHDEGIGPPQECVGREMNTFDHILRLRFDIVFDLDLLAGDIPFGADA